MSNRPDWNEWILQKNTEFEKADIYDIKSKKKIASLPSPDVGKRPKLGLKGALRKPIREPIAESPAIFENPPTTEGTAKKRRYQGGDPRHIGRFSVPDRNGWNHIKPTRAGIPREHVFGRPSSVTSGVSELRHEGAPQHTEHERRFAPDRSTGQPVKWHKSEEEEITLMKTGDRPDWNEWILQKNAEAKQEELRKSDEVLLEKALPGAANPKMGGSVFTMDHVNEVAAMKDHAAAKARAHEIVDASTANQKNRVKIKTMINSSRNSSHLAQGMSNHILAHPSEGLKVSS